MAPIRPLVIVGMHRSGESRVARLLERWGLFVGWRKYPRVFAFEREEDLHRFAADREGALAIRGYALRTPVANPSPP